VRGDIASSARSPVYFRTRWCPAAPSARPGADVRPCLLTSGTCIAQPRRTSWRFALPDAGLHRCSTEMARVLRNPDRAVIVCVALGENWRHRRRPPRIGVVLDAFDASYQSELVKLLSDACRARRLELGVFPCGILRASDLAAPERNSLYRLISARGPVDGLVILGSTILRQVGEVQHWIEGLRPLPLCSIGLELDGVPSVLPDNYNGVRELVRHLVVEHRARRLAFVGGPEGNQESRERLAAFRAELGAQELDPAQAPCLFGDFLPSSGRDAARTLLERPGHDLDAIVSANDYMALGILEVLATRPTLRERQIAVTGFDNVVEAGLAMPPLSTIEQPLQRLADVAISCLLAQLDGSPQAALPRVPTRAYAATRVGGPVRWYAGLGSRASGGIHPAASRGAGGTFLDLRRCDAANPSGASG
jgi:sigma-B regulation protein RsbU (phosphoserine phosphatase)